MKFPALLLLPLTVALVKAENTTTLSDLRVGGTDVTTPFPWLVALFTKDTLNYIGPGVVGNRYWVITTAQIASSTGGTNFIALQEVTTSDYATITQGRYYESNAVVIHGSYATGNTLNNIGIIKFCPTFQSKSVAPKAPAPRTIKSDDSITFLTFGTALRESTKKVAEDCMCDDIITYDRAQNFCVDSSLTVYTDLSLEKTSIAVNDGKPIGLCMDGRSNFGETYLDLGAFKSWFQLNAKVRY